MIEKKSNSFSYIASSIIWVLTSILFYLRLFNDFSTSNRIIYSLIGGLVVTIIVFFVGEYKKKIRDKNLEESPIVMKTEKKDITWEELKKILWDKKRLVICVILGILFAIASFAYLGILAQGIPMVVTYFAFLVGIIYMFFTLFKSIKEVTLSKIIQSPLWIISYVVIPTCFFIIPLLGAINKLYPYQSVLIEKVREQLSLSFGTGGIITEKLIGVVQTLFNLGYNSPKLIIFLTIATLLFLTWKCIYDWNKTNNAHDWLNAFNLFSSNLEEEEKKDGK